LPESAPAALPDPAAAPALPAFAEPDRPDSLEIPEAEETALATQENPPDWALPGLPSFGEWRAPMNDEEDEVEGNWRAVGDLPALADDFQPLAEWRPTEPQTMNSQLFDEYTRNGQRFGTEYEPGIGEFSAPVQVAQASAQGYAQPGAQASAQATSISQAWPWGAVSSRSAAQPATQWSFDPVGGLLDSFGGLGLLFDGLLAFVSLNWLFGGRSAGAVRLILYAVPTELGVMAHNALVNKGIRATAVEYRDGNATTMEEFFFNVPEKQEDYADYVLDSINLMWRKV